MKIQHLLLLALTGTALAQGPLTPPPGADPSIGPVNALNGGLPQAAMKTLHQVEPRTAIAGGNSSVTINQSGAYYLAGNITVASGDGIAIAASNVTLDLNGFSVSSGAAPAAGTAIVLGSVVNIAIRNGNVGGGFAGGVRFIQSGGSPQPPSNVRIADLSIAYVTEAGISVSEAQVERCMVSCTNVTARGIDAWSVKDSRVQGGTLNGIVVKDCYVSNSTTNGITAHVVENSVSITAGNAIHAKCLTNSYAGGGGNHDVISAGVAQNVWAEGGSGSGDGIEASVVGNSYGQRQSDLGGASTGDGVRVNTGNAVVGVASGGRGVSGSILQLAQGSSSGGNGVQADVVSFSRAGNSGGIGIVGANVFGSFATGNSGRGIYSALIGNSRADFSGNGGLVTDGGVIGDSVAFTNTGVGAEGGVVSGVWASGNSLVGIDSLGSVTHSSADHNAGAGIRGRSVVGAVAYANQGDGIVVPTVGSDEYGAVALSIADSNIGIGISGGNSAILSCSSGRNEIGFLHKSAALVGSLAHANRDFGIQGTSFSAHSLNNSGFNWLPLGTEGGSLKNYSVRVGQYETSSGLGNGNLTDY